jgi:hypothetical protein
VVLTGEVVRNERLLILKTMFYFLSCVLPFGINAATGTAVACVVAPTTFPRGRALVHVGLVEKMMDRVRARVARARMKK